MFNILVVLLCYLWVNVYEGTEISPQCDEYNNSNCITISSMAQKILSYYANSSGQLELVFQSGQHYLNRNLTFMGDQGNQGNYKITSVNLQKRSVLTCQELSRITIHENASVQVQNVDFYNCSLFIIQNNLSMIGISNSSFHGSASDYAFIHFSRVSIAYSDFHIPLYILKAFTKMTKTRIEQVSATGILVKFLSEMYNLSRCHSGVLSICFSMVETSDLSVFHNHPDTSKLVFDNSISSSKTNYKMIGTAEDLIYVHNSTLNLSGLTTIQDNCGVIRLSQSRLQGTGNVSIADNFKISECLPTLWKNAMISSLHSFIILNGCISIVNNVISAIHLDQSSLILYGNAYLSKNSGIQGGAILASNAIVTFYGSALIFDNYVTQYGGAIYLYQSILTFYNDCTIAHNFANNSGGGIFSYLSQLDFHKHAEVQNNSANKGGGMYLSSSQIRLHSRIDQKQITVRISSNNAINGGGIYLSANSMIKLLKYDRDRHFLDTNNSMIEVMFTNNEATMKGGAIFVNDYSNFPMCSQTDGILSDCFIQVLRTSSFQSPHEGERTIFTNVKFTNNYAPKGSTYYGGLTDRCKQAFFSETSKFSMTYEIEYETIADIDSDPLSVRFCDNHNTSESVLHFEIVRGQLINVSVIAHNQNQQKVSANLLSRVNSGHGGLGEGEAIQGLHQNCTAVTYNIASSQPSEELTLYGDGPCRDSNQSKVTLNVTFIPCPIGFGLSKSNTKCVCDQKISTFECDIESMTIIRVNNDSWVTYVNCTAEGILVYPHCPYNYCYPPYHSVHILFDSGNGSDSQCNFNRSGTLCGGCQKGLSLVIGSSKCKKCGNKTLLLLVPIALAGIFVVLILLLLDLTVDVGTINGLILYANTITVVSTNSNTIYTNMVIEWVNLSLGFEVCFFNGMDEYSRTWLELAFPLYLILLVMIIMVASERSNKLASMLGSSNPVATLATLIFLSYARLLRISIHILSFGILVHPDGHSEYVWLADANVKYFQGKHIPLFLIGIAILLISFIYMFFLMFQHLIPYKNTLILKWLDSPKLRSFMDAYHAPFRPHFRGWCGFLLFFRTIVYLTSSLNYTGDQQTNLVCVAILSFATINIKNVCGRIYKNQVSKIETLYLLNLGVFSVVAMYARQVNISQVPLMYVSQSVALLMLLLLLCYHFEMKVGLLSKISKTPMRKPSNVPSIFLESSQSTNNEYVTASTYISSGSKSTTQENSRRGSQLPTTQQERSRIQSFSEFREELLDY